MQTDQPSTHDGGATLPTASASFPVPTPAEYEALAASFEPWRPSRALLDAGQPELQFLLAQVAGAQFGREAFVAPNAQILTSKLVLSDRSFVAAGAVLRGHVEIGADCSVNHYAHIAGLVRIGNNVRIAALVSILGFNHGHADISRPIWQQPVTSKGIQIGDNVWIGANSVILDGVQIGSHCIIAAGSVVTRSVSDYNIIAGNPARVLRDRRNTALE